MHLPSGFIEANVSSIAIDLTIEGIQTTTTTSTQAGPRGLLFESLLILGVILGWQRYKKNRM